MVQELTHQPGVLFVASIQRMEESRKAFKNSDWVLSFYLEGLSVECILQAIAIRAGAEHDAKHDLSKWSFKCPLLLQDTLKSSSCREHWSAIRSNWANGIRYFSDEACLTYCRQKQLLYGWKGDNRAKMIQAIKSFIDSAEVIQKKGLSVWHYSKKS